MAADKGRATGRIAQQLNAGLIARLAVLHVGTARLGSLHSACRCPGKAVSRQCGCAASGCRPPGRLPRHAFHASRTPASNRHPRQTHGPYAARHAATAPATEAEKPKSNPARLHHQMVQAGGALCGYCRAAGRGHGGGATMRRSPTVRTRPTSAYAGTV